MDPFAVDVQHLVTRYATLALEVLEDSSFAGLDSLAVESYEDEDAWRKKCLEEEQSMSRALDRYKHLCDAEQRRLSSAGGELLGVYAAARRQELETAKRCFQDSEMKSLFAQKVADRGDVHIGPLSKKTPQPSPRDSSGTGARSAWVGEVGRAVITAVRTDWRNGQQQVLRQLAKDMRAALDTTMEVLEKQLAQQQSSAEAAQWLWSKHIERLKVHLKRLVEAYRLTLAAMCQAELKEVEQHRARQSLFFEQETQMLKDYEKEESKQRAAKIKRLKLALAKWQKEYMADALEKGSQSNAIRQLVAARANQEEEADDDREAVSDRLEACGIVMDHLWESRAELQEEAWNFLHGLEDEVPCTVETLQLYEDFLSQHGIVVCGGALVTTSKALEEAENALRDAEPTMAGLSPAPAAKPGVTSAASPAKGGKVSKVGTWK